MAEITAGMVKALREKTDAPMMECKKALTEAAGDMAKAEELLRVRLGNKASKAAARVTAEGIVAVSVSPDGKRGALLELNCETDFVAKNDDFNAFAARLSAMIVSENPADVAALSALPMDGSTVETVRTALVGKIGENLSIRRFQRFETEGLIAAYVHGGAKIGALVNVVGGDAALAKDLAMHIAARKPKALAADGVPSDLIETERRIATEKALESGKPPEIVARTVEGTIQKFIKEVTLLGQPFIKDDKASVEQMLKSRKARIDAFALYLVGEGIERRETDFAAEVAAQAAAAAAAR